MSKTSRNIIILIVVVLVILGIWWYASSTLPQSASVVPVTPAQQNIAPNNTQGSTSGAGSVSSANPQDTSDTAINSDLSNIDTQMKGLNADSTSINQSLTTQ